MKKLVLIIVMAIAATVFFPTEALAYSDISVSGDWECSYEINEYGVGASGGTATVSLKVVNTHATDDITYVSVTWGAGMASEYYEVKNVGGIAPGAGMYIDFDIPVEAEDAGIGNTLWVAMSSRGASNVDGIGAVTGIVFGPEPEYTASCEISTGTTTIDRGDMVKIAFGGAMTGNKAVDIKVYDQTGYLIFSMDDMDILYLGSKEYAPTSTTTYQYTCKVYKPGTDTLMNEVTSSPLTVTVIQPDPDPEPEPEPEEETPATEPEEETTTEPEVTAEPEITSEPETSTEAAEAEVEAEISEENLSLSSNERTVVVETNEQIDEPQNSQNTLMMILIVLLIMIFAALASLLIYMVKNNSKQ